MTNQLRSLQSLRLLAAMGIFLFHLWSNYLHNPFIHPGTDYFILLVGVVSAVSQSRHIATGGWRKYIVNRYIRLYVAFIPVFILYLIARHDPMNWVFDLKSFFFIPLHDQLPLVPQTWMVSYFLIFYWLFSLAFVFRNEKVLTPIFLIWATGCIYFSWAGWKPRGYDEFYMILFDIRNLEFMFGYLVGKIISTQRISVRIASWALIFGILALSVSVAMYNIVIHQIDGTDRVFMFGIPLAMITIGLATMEQHGSKNPLFLPILHPWLVWLGNASYLLFLTHGLILRIWDSIIAPVTLIQVPILILIVLILSAVGYQFFERPLIQYLRAKTSIRKCLKT